MSEAAARIMQLDPLGRRACADVDPEVMYPEARNDFYGWRTAKAVCARCPIIDDCLMIALEEREEFGCWGGKDEDERRALRVRMGALVTA